MQRSDTAATLEGTTARAFLPALLATRLATESQSLIQLRFF